MDQTSADKTGDIWTPHLKPGERLVWSGAVADHLYLAALGRRRQISLLVMLAAGAAAFVFGLNFVNALFARPAGETFHFMPSFNMPGLVMAPLYFAFGVTCAIVAVAQAFRLNLPRPAAARFAVTDARLIALDATGAVADEIPGPDISGVIAGGRRRTPDVYVLRKGDAREERVFAIEYIDNPLEAKAVIEETFLEPPVETAP